jgi:hypothetical protein
MWSYYFISILIPNFILISSMNFCIDDSPR